MAIKKINHHIFLKQLSGIFILCCLLLSITPRQFLHELAANHHDQPVKKYAHGEQYSVAGYNCECNQTVATSPFTEIFNSPALCKFLSFSYYIEEIIAPAFFDGSRIISLRGPPKFA